MKLYKVETPKKNKQKARICMITTNKNYAIKYAFDCSYSKAGLFVAENCHADGYMVEYGIPYWIYDVNNSKCSEGQIEDLEWQEIDIKTL